MGLLCMLFPAAVFCRVRNRLFGIRQETTVHGFLKLLFEYLSGNALINSIVILLRLVLVHASGNVFEELNADSGFAVKYLALAVALACILPYAESALAENWGITFQSDFGLGRCRGVLGNKARTAIVWIYAAFMAAQHFIRVFDNFFWGDEGIAIKAARMPWEDMMEYVALNGHSPFHYAFAWAFVKIFGESGLTYHLSATLPYFITVAISVTLVRKWFGNKACMIVVTLSALLESAVIYNLEVRMYAWCQMFLFAAYLMLYGIMKTRKDKYYVLMALYSMGAVYAHYFALAGVGFMYLVLLVYTVKEKIDSVCKVMVSGGSVLVLLFPWLIYAKRIHGVVISDFGMEWVSFYDCLKFIFHSGHSMFLLAMFFAVLLLRFLYSTGIIDVKKDGDGRNTLALRLDIQNLCLDRKWEWVWMAGGMAAVFGTIAVSEAISMVMYPIIVLRYLYPSFIIIWLLFAVNISKCRLAGIWTVLLTMLLFMDCYPVYLDTVKGEWQSNERLEAALAVTEIDEEDFIYTDIVHFDWTLADVYYPGTPHALFGQAGWWGTVELPWLGGGYTEYWLFLGEPISEQLTVRLETMGYEPELVVDNGVIGLGSMWVYKAVTRS